MAQDIQSVMTRDPVTVDADAALVDAAQAMEAHDIGDVLVVDGGQLVGIVTDRDLAVRGTARGADPLNTSVGDVCSRELVMVEADQTAEGAIAIMRDRALRRLPVVQDGRPIGIVSLGDLAVQRERDSVLGEVSAARPNR